MLQISKLRARLKNVQKNVTEYRMTVIEAKELLAEIDELLKPKEIPVEVIIKEQPAIVRITDGGTF